ncbi:MAG: hypothetical protein ACK56I_27050, partial [bacterium]
MTSNGIESKSCSDPVLNFKVGHFNNEQIVLKFDQFDQDFKGSMGANFKSKIAKCLISLALKFDPNP